MAATLLLFMGETFEIEAISDWVAWYEQTALSLLQAPLPGPLLDFMENR